MYFRLAIAVCLLLTGCAHYQPQPISAANSAARFDARSLDDPKFQAFIEKNLPAQTGGPRNSWSFSTLTLAAFYYHPSLGLARAQWQTALAANETAAARPNPTVSVVPGYNFSATSGVSPWIPAINFDIPIEIAGKRGYRKAQAESLSESARLNIAVAIWHVRNNLQVALIDNATASQREKLLQRQTAIQERIARSLEQQLQAGAISSFELSQSQIALGKGRLELADARRELADSRARVADAIGIPVRALENVELNYDLSTRPAGVSDLMSSSARDYALQNRADIRAALFEYEAAQSALQLEIARQYPDIHLGPGYQYDQGDHKFTLALTAELPLLNQNQGPIAEAFAKRAEAAARFNLLQAKVLSDIDRAVTVCRVTTENLTTLQGLSAAHEKQAQAVEAQRKAGSADLLDESNAQLELVTGELALLDGRTKLQQSFAALEDALHRPADAPVLPFNEKSPGSQAMKQISQ